MVPDPDLLTWLEYRLHFITNQLHLLFKVKGRKIGLYFTLFYPAD
jgi:hypothetical protein